MDDKNISFIIQHHNRGNFNYFETLKIYFIMFVLQILLFITLYISLDINFILIKLLLILAIVFIIILLLSIIITFEIYNKTKSSIAVEIKTNYNITKLIIKRIKTILNDNKIVYKTKLRTLRWKSIGIIENIVIAKNQIELIFTTRRYPSDDNKFSTIIIINPLISNDHKTNDIENLITNNLNLNTLNQQIPQPRLFEYFRLG